MVVLRDLGVFRDSSLFHVGLASASSLTVLLEPSLLTGLHDVRLLT